MVEHGNAKVISSPRIVAQNNVQQMLNATEQYPILTSNVSNGVSTQTVTYQPIGLQLKVSADDRLGPLGPHQHRRFVLHDPRVRADYPVIGQRQTTGSFRIADDETLGPVRADLDEDSSTLEKAPVLGDLPLIGAFFRHLITTHRKTELVFLLTPHVRPKVLTTSDVLVPFPLPPQPSPEAAPPPHSAFSRVLERGKNQRATRCSRLRARTSAPPRRRSDRRASECRLSQPDFK